MSEKAATPTSTHDDGRFVRTALIVGAEDFEGKMRGGSVAVVNTNGERLALLNIFTNEYNTWFAVDVIDIDNRYNKRTAIVFNEGAKDFLDTGSGNLVAADFRMKEDA